MKLYVSLQFGELTLNGFILECSPVTVDTCMIHLNSAKLMKTNNLTGIKGDPLYFKGPFTVHLHQDTDTSNHTTVPVIFHVYVYLQIIITTHYC